MWAVPCLCKGNSSPWDAQDQVQILCLADISCLFENLSSIIAGTDMPLSNALSPFLIARIPLQTHLRPPAPSGFSRKIRADQHELAPGAQSQNSTITSVNSISSLLKEKLQWTIPQALRNTKKQQTADYRYEGGTSRNPDDAISV